MKIGLSTFVALLLLAPSIPALAQSEPAPAPATQPASEPPTATPTPTTPEVTEPAPALATNAAAETPSMAEAPPPDTAHAKEHDLSKSTGFAIAFQTGYMIPAGKVTGEPGDEMGRVFGGQIPIWIEAGARVTPNVFLGVYGALGFGTAGDDLDHQCSDHGISCSTHSLRAGLAFRYRVFAGESTQPWFGYAAGYESNSVLFSGPGAESTISLTGWEYARLSAGLDFSDNHVMALGPVLEYGVGQYNHMSQESSGKPTTDKDITNTAVHQWVTLGLRLTFMQ